MSIYIYIRRASNITKSNISLKNYHLQGSRVYKPSHATVGRLMINEILLSFKVSFPTNMALNHQSIIRPSDNTSAMPGLTELEKRTVFEPT